MDNVDSSALKYSSLYFLILASWLVGSFWIDVTANMPVLVNLGLCMHQKSNILFNLCVLCFIVKRTKIPTPAVPPLVLRLFPHHRNALVLNWISWPPWEKCFLLILKIYIFKRCNSAIQQFSYFFDCGAFVRAVTLHLLGCRSRPKFPPFSLQNHFLGGGEWAGVGWVLCSWKAFWAPRLPKLLLLNMCCSCSAALTSLAVLLWPVSLKRCFQSQKCRTDCVFLFIAPLNSRRAADSETLEPTITTHLHHPWSHH